jgi:glycosyltransferase involved in cell wall biosynthesis
MEHEFHVIYTSMNEDNRQWTLQKEKMLNSHVLNSRVIKIKGKLDDRYIHFPWNLLKILKEINPSIVIAGEYNPAALQSMAWCKLYNKKFIHLTDGTLFSERNIGKFQKIARKIICSQADACIASSTKAKEKLLKWGVKEKKIFVSLLTVDTTKYKNLKREPINGRILYVGSMVKRKGLDLLIDALQYVQCDFELHIVGNGNDAENNALKSAIKEKGMDSRVVFCGFKEGDKLLDEYAHAQLFVLPTREDCFGLVLLEAACAGVPIISSKYADGAYDIVQENINGFIIDPYDAKHFGDTIDIALNNKKLMKDVSGECIDKFSFPKVIAGYIDAFSYVMKGKN